jgi:hypothetical protein
MKLTLRAAAAGTFLAALAAAGLSACPALAQEAGIDFWHIPDLRGGMSDSERWARDLELEGEVIGRRVALRTETVRDVVAGRVGIAEAVRRFAELNRTDPRGLRRVRHMYDGATDEERAGWQLVAHLRAYRDPRADAAADAAACHLAYPEAAH